MTRHFESKSRPALVHQIERSQRATEQVVKGLENSSRQNIDAPVVAETISVNGGKPVPPKVRALFFPPLLALRRALGASDEAAKDIALVYVLACRTVGGEADPVQATSIRERIGKHLDHAAAVLCADPVVAELWGLSAVQRYLVRLVDKHLPTTSPDKAQIVVGPRRLWPGQKTTFRLIDGDLFTSAGSAAERRRLGPLLDWWSGGQPGRGRPPGEGDPDFPTNFHRAMATLADDQIRRPDLTQYNVANALALSVEILQDRLRDHGMSWRRWKTAYQDRRRQRSPQEFGPN